MRCRGAGVWTRRWGLHWELLEELAEGAHAVEACWRRGQAGAGRRAEQRCSTKECDGVRRGLGRAIVCRGAGAGGTGVVVSAEGQLAG